MHYYLDTNILLPLYREGTIKLLQQNFDKSKTRKIFISDLGMLELTSVLMRISRTRDDKGKKVISRRKIRKIIKRLNYDFRPTKIGSIEYLATTPIIVKTATELVITHGPQHNLRCRDAIHLAFVFSLNQQRAPFYMITYDQALANLCQKLGVFADISELSPQLAQP